MLCSDTATTQMYTYGHTLSLHDALPIYRQSVYYLDRQPGLPGATRHLPAGGRIGGRDQYFHGPSLCRPRSTCKSQPRSEEHTSELQSLMRISYAVFCLKKQSPPYPPYYTSSDVRYITSLQIYQSR